jgi:hypothetical protein
MVENYDKSFFCSSDVKLEDWVHYNGRSILIGTTLVGRKRMKSQLGEVNYPKGLSQPIVSNIVGNLDIFTRISSWFKSPWVRFIILHQ